VGQTYDLTAICTPSAACPNAVDWESDADSVANVTDLGNGKARVTARSEGTANIIATSPDYCGIEIGDVVTVTVTDEEVEVASVEVEDACICVDEGFQLEVFVKDSDGNILTDRAVTWTTSDSRIAWVKQLKSITAPLPALQITASHGHIMALRNVNGILSPLPGPCMKQGREKYYGKEVLKLT